jgi:BirA family biotin operon repressor/biotin-[acetyl-CoA-carboxylase] ligase
MFDGDLIFLHETASTNTYLKELARNQEIREGTCVFCESQKEGRGRLGRSWYQEPFTNIAMSVLLRPDIRPQLAPAYSILAGVSVYEALYELTGAKLRIKWPNDIMANGKKLCGILTELDAEAEKVVFLVIGIGINVYKRNSDMPLDVQSRAVTLQEICKGRVLPKRADIIRRILDKIQVMYERNKAGITGELIDLWKQYSDMIGRRIYYDRGTEGIVSDIDCDGSLVVDTKNGRDRIFSGMIFEIEGYNRGD